MRDMKVARTTTTEVEEKIKSGTLFMVNRVPLHQQESNGHRPRPVPCVSDVA